MVPWRTFHIGPERRLTVVPSALPNVWCVTVPSAVVTEKVWLKWLMAPTRPVWVVGVLVGEVGVVAVTRSPFEMQSPSTSIWGAEYLISDRAATSHATA